MPKEDNFFSNVNKFFKRVQGQDLIKLSSNKINVLGKGQSFEEQKAKQQLQVFRQYLNSKNWNLKHLELYDEYRRMDQTYPIINAALRLYAQEVCVTGDCVIQVGGGSFTIKELYDNPRANQYFSVKSFDIERQRVLYNTCHGIISNGIKKVYKVKVARNISADAAEYDTKEEASFKCTDNHKILCADKTYKELKDLKPGDLIYSYYEELDPECKCKKAYINSTIIQSIEEAGEEEVFDLKNVIPNHNFALKLTDSFFVIVHNCNKDEEGRIYNIITDEHDVKMSLEECFDRNLKLNTRSYHLVRAMLKFGNAYSFLDCRRGVGVTDLIYLPPEALRIQLIDNAERLDDFKYIWQGYGQGLPFEPWELVHWKTIEDIESDPYGTSILRSIVDTWRRIIMMREALVIYRITRAPQRLLYKIDTSNLDPDSALRHAEAVKKSLTKKPLVNPATGEIDFKFNQVSIEENIYMPTFEGDVGNVEVLEGAGNLDQVEDYKILKDDLFAGLLIPKSYLTFEEDLCLRENTLVRTNEGSITIKELADNFSKNENLKIYTLSCNEFGFVTTGKINWCKPTKKVESLYKITLSSGKFVECTENHPFLLETMVYKRADELKEGDLIKNIHEKEIRISLIEIISLEHPEFVYDLGVDIYHNFALESGIFVHNSNKAALAQEDLRFNNAVQQYQTHYIEGLLHIGLVHLYLNGYSKDELESFEIQMNNSSTLKEKTKNELLQQRLDLFHSAIDNSTGGIAAYSYTDALRKILKFTDEEIARTFQDQLIEKKLIWKLKQLEESGFYEEPDPEKKKAKLKGLDTDNDIFKGLQFESDRKEAVEKVLRGKIDKEIDALNRPAKLKATKKQIDNVVRLHESKLKGNIRKTFHDLGGKTDKI